MADPAWGAASTASSAAVPLHPPAHSARALYALRHSEPLATARRQPLQQQSPTSLSHSLPPAPVHAMPPDVCGLSVYGRPSSDRGRVTSSLGSQRDDGALLSVDRRTSSSTLNNEWRRQPLDAVRVPLEQQSMQEPTPWHCVETNGVNAATWSSGAQCGDGPAWGLQSDRRQTSALHREVWNTAEFRYGGGDGRRPLLAEATRAPPAAPLYMLEYGANRMQREGAADARDEMRARPPTAESVQLHIQRHNCTLCAMSVALYQWAQTSSVLSAAVQTDKVERDRLQESDQCIHSQQLPHKDSYHPAESCQRCSSEEFGMSTRTDRSSHDGAFLGNAARHVTASTALPAAGRPAVSDATHGKVFVNEATCNLSPAHDVLAGLDARHAGAVVGTAACTSSATRDVSAGFDAKHADASADGTTCTPSPVQCPIQNEADKGVQGQDDARSSIQPSRAAVVPGISLASHAARLVTMQDILNGEDQSNKASMSRHRSRDGTHDRVPCKRKVRTPNIPTKRQKVPERQSARDHQPSPKSRPTGVLLQTRDANDVSASSITPTAKPCTPMYLAFMESRAARASKQVQSSVAGASSLYSQSTMPVRAAKSSAVTVKQKNGRPNLVTTKMVDMNAGVCKPSRALTSNQRTRTLHLDTARSRGVSSRKQVLDSLHVGVSDRNRRMEEPCALIKREPCANSGFDEPIGQLYKQHRWQQPRSERSVHDSRVVSGMCSSIKSEIIDNETDILLKKRRRAKLPLARPTRPKLTIRQQQVQGPLRLDEELIPTYGSGAASAVDSATVSHGHAVNRTVVIFCKRDFMRYQAAKIWRKYQEQQKKHEEWREVRVAGKRTRYLNSRYDDQIQRTYRKPYMRSTKPQRKPFPKTGKSRSRKATVDISVVEPMSLPSVSSDKRVSEEGLSAREPDSTTTSELLRNVDDDSLSSGKRGVADCDERLVTRDASQSHDGRLPQGQGDVDIATPDSSVGTFGADDAFNGSTVPSIIDICKNGVTCFEPDVKISVAVVAGKPLKDSSEVN
ncbi:unnamed protein product [Hyaloperonospora brassicae]|uniref:CCT domain-containing protein n=1 Tax=Hyaloperonospora brassicae TaxID=162125 RepID=A0AAV0TBF1_HYABA|nr:unnamed protein product [Hyaloperonospora brassicae]